ncbi:SPBC14C8.15, partial [Fragariocoptes setiger]
MNNNILSGKFKFIFISSLLIVLFLKEISCHKTSDEVERDRCKSIGLSKSRGYQVEVHTVETKGKYLLTLHRLVNKKVPPNHLRRPYVLFHGILGSSGGFVTNIKKVTEAGYANPDEDIQHYGQHNKNIYHNLSNEEEQFLRELENVQVGGLAQSLLTSGSLAFTLSNFGYDIWLVNLRGNHYSNKQSRGVRPDASLFYWNFNLDTVAEDDIKPIFDYVRWITQSQQVGVVSYSFSSALIMRFLNQNYEQYGIIRPIIMMAPTLFTGSTMDTKNKLLFRGLSKMLSKNGPYPGDKKNLLGP